MADSVQHTAGEIEAVRRADGESRSLAASLPRLVLEARRIANNVIHVNNGKVTMYPGTYDYFLHKKSLEDNEEAALFRSEEVIESHTHGFEAAAPKPAEKKASELTDLGWFEVQIAEEARIGDAESRGETASRPG